MENGIGRQKRSDICATEERTVHTSSDINTSRCAGFTASTLDKAARQSCEVETSRMRLESASNNVNCAGNHDENWELTSTRDEPASEENILHGDLELRLPTPPSGSPDAEDREDCAPVSTDNVGSVTSSLSERDSYTWNSASVDLPSLLTLCGDGNERLIWPLEVTGRQLFTNIIIII